MSNTNHCATAFEFRSVDNFDYDGFKNISNQTPVYLNQYIHERYINLQTKIQGFNKNTPKSDHPEYFKNEFNKIDKQMKILKDNSFYVTILNDIYSVFKMTNNFNELLQTDSRIFEMII